MKFDLNTIIGIGVVTVGFIINPIVGAILLAAGLYTLHKGGNF